ncbi:MAG: hypothetical protein QNL04_13145 [SAR324 cluster bacterium]|nr:hypothetical protein [SAR324 cluster bacterium]
MILLKNRFFLFLLLLLLVFSGCRDESTVSTLALSEEGTGTYTILTDKGGAGSFEYSQDLGTDTKDVYFVFSNSSASSSASTPAVSSSNIGTTDPATLVAPPRKQIQTPRSFSRDLDIATQFNANPPIPTRSANQSNLVVPDPVKASVGSTNDFFNTSTSDTISSTLRTQVSDGTITVNIWVEDISWTSGCTRSACITQTMADTFADTFLLTGSNNDIYDWVTNIYGVPWGSHSYSGSLIAASAATTIDILFYDIDADDSQTGGVLGFSWSKDNYSTSAISYSNERLIFYMDSVMTATETGTDWDITDTWPAEMVSTLAHEFQHMIHFYQKTVLATGFSSGSETWLNEMCSMSAEDLIASKLLNSGPRGVIYSDPTAGSSGMTGDRLAYYNYYNDYSLTNWLSGNYVLYSYGISYSFGAYLTRNFGGADLMQAIVQNEYTGTQAVTDGVATAGYTQRDGSAHTMQSLLHGWAIAGLLSSGTSAASGYRYNTGGNFSSSIGSITYVLGSINLFNYGTPYFYTPSTLGSEGAVQAYSNRFVKVATNATGVFTRTVTVPSGVDLIVITK